MTRRKKKWHVIKIHKFIANALVGNLQLIDSEIIQKLNSWPNQLWYLCPRVFTSVLPFQKSSATSSQGSFICSQQKVTSWHLACWAGLHQSRLWSTYSVINTSWVFYSTGGNEHEHRRSTCFWPRRHQSKTLAQYHISFWSLRSKWHFWHRQFRRK